MMTPDEDREAAMAKIKEGLQWLLAVSRDKDQVSWIIGPFIIGELVLLF